MPEQIRKTNSSPRTITIFIKHMVSSRCMRVIREELEKTGKIWVQKISLGSADISFDPVVVSLDDIGKILLENGFELMHDKDSLLVEQIKIAVLEMIYYGNNLNTIIRNSDYLSDKLGLPYLQISKIFSDHTGTTLEKYIILVKIERVKELISYGEMTLSEISYMMGYSSVQYLSNQFKQVSGYSVTEYKHLPDKPRKSLDSLLN
jgi:AraC family transcriptional regulator